MVTGTGGIITAEGGVVVLNKEQSFEGGNGMDVGRTNSSHGTEILPTQSNTENGTAMEELYKPLVTSDTRIKVSSTLDKTAGKKNLTDGNPETCWTSQQGLPQIIQLVFPERVCPTRLILTFQGGFVGTHCSIDTAISSEDPSWSTLTHIHPEDVNRRQAFLLPEGAAGGIQCLKLRFEKSSDFFGRITLYELQVEGLAP